MLANTIVVTATKRRERLSEVPIAVSAVSADALELTGASDIRQLNQLVPSLFVYSTSNEVGAGVARIRGVGTIGDNPGIESSVPVFIDGVYRARVSVGLTELGPLERIEVLRGPQGTLFGRNASAGLINVLTAQPSFEDHGEAEFSYGNYDYVRGVIGVTGPLIADRLALRLDGVYVKRDGFVEDAISGRDLQNRDRYLVRGQLLYEPTDALRIRLVGDYSSREEECCGGIYAPFVDRVRTADGFRLEPSAFLPVLQSFTDPAGNPFFANDNLDRRLVSITPGRSYEAEVEDWGVAAHLDWDLGLASLASITAYRDWNWLRSQDNDFNNLDLFYRDGWDETFRTFTQELRLQGKAFDDRLDWLVGGYFANEDLSIVDNLRFGTQFGDYANAIVAFNSRTATAGPGLLFRSFPALGGYANLPGVIDALLAANGVPAAGRGAIAGLVSPLNLSDVGVGRDEYLQDSRNFAFFTHNAFAVTDRLKVTVGLRYTNEKKELDMRLLSNNLACASIRQSIANVNALGTSTPALAGATAATAAALTGLSGLPCLINYNTTLDGRYQIDKREDEWSGTAVLSYSFSDRLLAYASYSRGYKAGGFNLDRSSLDPLNPDAAQLVFEPEKVDSYELGAKLSLPGLTVNAALFRQLFEQFQLNTFNGATFFVENLQSCKGELAPPAPGQVFGACTGGLRGGLKTEGVEVEALAEPVENVFATAGVTYSDVRYRDRLVGIGGRALANELFLLPGSQVSNAPEWTLTGSLAWTPPVGARGLSALFYLDGRYQTEMVTGSDLDIEKQQGDYVLVNARIGLRGPEGRWALELWAQNLLDTDYVVVGFDEPLQPIGGAPGSRVTARPAGSSFASDRSTALYGRFPGEPRTWGLTLRTRF